VIAPSFGLGTEIIGEPTVETTGDESE